MLSPPFHYLYISTCLCAIEDMSLWELIAAIRLLIQLIAALGSSFSLCCPREACPETLLKQFLFRRRKTFKALPDILFPFCL